MRELAGTRALVRLILRRDRIWLPVWVLLPMLIAWSQVSFVAALPDWEAFLAEMRANPVAEAVLGPVVPMSVAGAYIWRAAPQAIAVLAIASLLTVIRHTRADEQAGRSELVRGAVVGRYGPLTAAMVVTCVANLVAGMLAALVLTGAGLPAGGALLFGLTLAAAGWFYAGVGALSAQVRESAGGARGIALAVFGLAFVAYSWNNLGGGYIGWAWLSPMAWWRLTQPFAGDHGWVLLALAALAALAAAAAYVLAAGRDFGAGLIPSRLGPGEAAPGLRSPLALAWRLHRVGMVAWTAGLVLLGAGLGAGVPSVAEGLSDMMAGMGTGEWTERVSNREGFMAVSIYVVALLIGATVYAIMTVLRLRREETEGRAEPLLAQPVSRIQWMASHLAVAFAGSLFLLLALGVGAGLGWGLVAGDVGGVLPRVLVMSLSKAPAVWVVLGIAAAAYGLLPRAATVASWGFLALFLIIEMAWEVRLVDWSVMRLSPFSYVHYSIPITELPVLPLFGLTVLAAALTAGGLAGFRRRDVG